MTNSPNSLTAFNRPGAIAITTGAGGLTRIDVTAGDESLAWSAVAEIYLNGATVTRYEVNGKPVLFCSRTSKYEAGKAIRGGVPVIFPWFGPHPTDPALPQHGFARTAEWKIASTNTGADKAAV